MKTTLEDGNVELSHAQNLDRTLSRPDRVHPLVMQTATLTNNGSLLKEAIAEILPAAAEVFGASFHASYEFGARKPDPIVFERLAAHYRVATQRVLLIDDQPEYIAGAHSAGLNTILFATPHELVLQLGTLLPSD